MEKVLYSTIRIKDIINIILGYYYNPIDNNVRKQICQSYKPREYNYDCGHYYYTCRCQTFWNNQVELEKRRLLLHNLNN
jgi:hypothetical protein